MASSALSESQTQPADYSNWMGELPEELHKIQLNHLAIPGSHNSATYTMDSDAPIAPDQSPAVQQMISLLGPQGKTLFRKWSVCQSLSLTRQLQAGIRYLDLRIARRPHSKDFYTIHGLFCQKLETNLEEIVAFAKSHPKEILLLDFNHLYNMNESEHEACVNIILESLGDLVCPVLDMASVTLETLWGSGLQILVFYKYTVDKTGMEIWSGNSISSPWADTESLPKLLSFLETSYQKPRQLDEFHATQGILTPTFGYIVSHMNESLKDTLSQKAAKPVVDWIQSKRAGAQGINICILDFVEMAEFIPTVLRLNRSIFAESD